MKNFISVIMCFLILTAFSSCSKKQDDVPPASINDIPSAAADSQESDTVKSDNPTKQASPSEEENEEYIPPNSDSAELRSEKERTEISNNLRDAQQLIDDGCFEDAMMIIKSLKTRKLSDEENKTLNKLQEQMMQLSD